MDTINYYKSEDFVEYNELFSEIHNTSLNEFVESINILVSEKYEMDDIYLCINQISVFNKDLSEYLLDIYKNSSDDVFFRSYAYEYNFDVYFYCKFLLSDDKSSLDKYFDEFLNITKYLVNKSNINLFLSELYHYTNDTFLDNYFDYKNSNGEYQKLSPNIVYTHYLDKNYYNKIKKVHHLFTRCKLVSNLIYCISNTPIYTNTNNQNEFISGVDDFKLRFINNINKWIQFANLFNFNKFVEVYTDSIPIEIQRTIIKKIPDNELITLGVNIPNPSHEQKISYIKQFLMTNILTITSIYNGIYKLYMIKPFIKFINYYLDYNEIYTNDEYRIYEWLNYTEKSIVNFQNKYKEFKNSELYISCQRISYYQNMCNKLSKDDNKYFELNNYLIKLLENYHYNIQIVI